MLALSSPRLVFWAGGQTQVFGFWWRSDPQGAGRAWARLPPVWCFGREVRARFLMVFGGGQTHKAPAVLASRVRLQGFRGQSLTVASLVQTFLGYDRVKLNYLTYVL